MNCSKIWEENQERCSSLSPLSETTVVSLQGELELTPRFSKTEVKVVNNDTLNEALLQKERGKVLLLNMANPTKPGGHPSLVGAQEEDLFRRTDLSLHLQESFYPLSNRLLLSKNVRVFSNGLRDAYSSRKEEKIDIISCPSLLNTSRGIWLAPIDAFLLSFRIETIFQTAYLEGYDILVLSAIGCGGFRCPPEHVSLIFRKTIERYQGCFSSIIFAIFDDNFPKSNFSVFSSTLSSLF